MAQKVKELDSYTEYSVSGTGIHVLVWGRLPWKKCDGDKIEMYDRSRFLVMTGNRVPGTPTEIRDAQDTIDAIHLEVFGAPEQISGKTALQQNQQLNPNPNNSYSQRRGKGEIKKEEGEGGPAADLTQNEWARINDLRDRLPKFASTWASARATSLWPFVDGRNSPSEYEASIAFFLIWDGWSEQSVMDAICCWRRQCGLKAPVHYSRYAITIGKAVAMVTPRSKGLGYTRKELKGAWKHGYTRDHILSCIIETPRTPKQIAEYTGITQATVYVVLGRLRKDGMVIRDNHTYLCAPTAVPWYLQNIPEDAGEPTSEEMEAEYEAWVAAGGLDAVEEEILPPLDAPAAAGVNPWSDWDAFLAAEELEPEPVLVAADVLMDLTGEFSAMYQPGLVDPYKYKGMDEEEGFRPPDIAHYRADMAAWEVKWKKETRDCAREARKHGNGAAQLKRRKLDKVYANRFMPSALDLELRRINEMPLPPINERDIPF